MDEQEIRERLKRYDKGRRDGTNDDSALLPFADWMADELERQLDRNHKLDKQLTEIVEAGEPFEKFATCCKETDSDAWIMCSTSGHKGGAHLRLYDFRRLAQAMKGVKDE